MERRRRLAAAGPLPPALACKFTTGELAALRIVADEVRQHGGCDRSYDEIAARAGVCRSLARRAMRLAARFGLLTIEVRPRPGRKHLTNVVRIVDAAWRAWLRIGGTKKGPTAKQDRKALEIKRRETGSATPRRCAHSPKVENGTENEGSRRYSGREQPVAARLKQV